MPRKEITLDEVREALRPPERIIALQAERDQISAAYKEYKKEHGQLDQLMAEVLAAIPSIKPQTLAYKPPKTKRVDRDVSVVLHVTDAHHGAIQARDEIEGFGVFSPELSRRRQFGFVRDVMDWVELHRTVYSIPEARFLVTGDLISGDIQDLRVTNAFPAPRQAVEAGEILAHQAAIIAPHFERVIVDIITLDNHGRMTRKPQSKEGGINNWMYVVGHIAKILLSAHKNVTVNIWAQPEKVVIVNGRNYLLCHGHEVSGWMGFPYYGIERKAAREAIKRMNGPDFTRFHRIIMGHWHAPLTHPHFWIGGSVSGTDAYDHQAGRQADPQQVSWMVHPQWGEFDRTEWQLMKWDK
jgi:hypothetical protein